LYAFEKCFAVRADLGRCSRRLPVFDSDGDKKKPRQEILPGWVLSLTVTLQEYDWLKKTGLSSPFCKKNIVFALNL